MKRGLIQSLLGVLLLTLLSPAKGQGQPLQDMARKKAREQLSRRMKPEFYLWSLPNRIAMFRQELRRWHRLRGDSANAADARRALEKVIQLMLSDEREFANFYAAYRRDSLNLQPILEFYDESVRNRLQWLSSFVAGPEWEWLHSGIDPQTLERLILQGRFDSLSDFRWTLSDFMMELQTRAERIPKAFQRPFADRWKQAEVPAVPTGGYASLQKRLRAIEHFLPRGLDTLLVISALIDEKGRVLRTQIVQSIGIDAVEEAVAALIQQTEWRPAQRHGRPFKTELRIPVRLWRKW